MPAPTFIQAQGLPPLKVSVVNWQLVPQTPMALALSRLPWNFIIGGALAVGALLLVTEERK
jgi:hypothetical protein